MVAICLHCFVSGRVQGVFYRREACEQAKKRGLTGYAKNCLDGRVEVMLCGEKEAVKKMSEWLWEGSPSSKVTKVEIKEAPLQIFSGFEVK